MTDQCKLLKNYTKRIKGQIEGIERMIDSKRDPVEILNQIEAARSAMARLAIELLKDESRECLGIEEKGDKEELEKKIKKFEELVKNFFKL